MGESFPGGGNWLAGEPSGDEVDGFDAVGCLFVEVMDVFPSRNVRPVLLEDLAAPVIPFDLSDAFHPGPFQAKVDSADSSEEAQVSHLHILDSEGSRHLCNPMVQ